jgi:hypothetical protein
MFWKKEIKTVPALVVILILASFAGSLLWIKTHYYYPEPVSFVAVKKRARKPIPIKKIERPKPQPVSMSRLKNQGCVTDGLLSEYNPERENYIRLMNRSNCYYFHRAVETWMLPPDFETIEYAMGRMSKKDVVYGLCIAEALRANAK